MSSANRRFVIAAGGLVLAQGPLGLARGLTRGAAVAARTPGHPRRNTAAAGGGTPSRGSDGGGAAARPGSTEDVSPNFPSTDPQAVGAVVGASHTDLDTVVELVSARPHLARATVDWGFGDWESALGAAAHMGRHDIAEFLLGHGARPNIFSAAMMGQLAVVRAMVEASPGVQRIPGPHGIPLLAHARAGGERAVKVLQYLERLGDADMHPDTVELGDDEREAFVGRYRFDAAEHDSFEVSNDRGALWLRRDGRPFGRRLFAVSRTEFYPSGSSTVRIAFEVGDDGGATLTIIDNEPVLSARRRIP